MANRFPMTIVSTERTDSILYQDTANGLNAVYNTVTKTNITDPFEITDKKEVTETGEPSYTSAVHRWNGTAEILNPNPEINNTKANICKGPPCKCSESADNVNVPVVPYIKDIPNNSNPDENADEMMNLKAASLDFFFSRSKLARAANGMLDNSNPR